MFKTYLSRHDSRRASLDNPVGDPTGGVACGERNDPVTAVAASGGLQAAGGIFGAREQSKAMGEAADIEAARLAELTRQYNLTQRRLRPFLRAGEESLERYQRQIGKAPDYAEIVAGIESDPGYQFALEQGTKAVEGSAAAQGLLRSGRTLTGLTQYAQDLARSKAGEAFGREAGIWQAKTGMLANLAAGGQAAATGAGYNPALQSTNLSEIAMQQGANTANLYGNLTNVGTSALSNLMIANQLQQQQQFNQGLLSAAPGHSSFIGPQRP
jgi:hypothetical protein